MEFLTTKLCKCLKLGKRKPTRLFWDLAKSGVLLILPTAKVCLLTVMFNPRAWLHCLHLLALKITSKAKSTTERLDVHRDAHKPKTDNQTTKHKEEVPHGTCKEGTDVVSDWHWNRWISCRTQFRS